MAMFRAKAETPAGAAPLTEYEQLLHDSRSFLAVERNRAAKPGARHRRRGAGAGTFLMCILFAIAAAVGTQFYLGAPGKEKLLQAWNGSVEAAQYFLN